MPTYYCDLAADPFVDNVGNLANPYTGPAGLQAAIRGTGAAVALAAGDILLTRDTGDLSRLVLLDTDNAGVVAWVVNDPVRDNGGGAVQWQGVVVENNGGGFLPGNDYVLVWLDAGYDETDIILANGAQNTFPRVPTPVGLDAVSTPGIKVDNASGDIVAGSIHFIGCDASWTANTAQAILDGSPTATYCLEGGNIVYIRIENFTFQNSVSHALYFNTAQALRWRFIGCIAQGAGGTGCYSATNRLEYATFEWCQFLNNIAAAGDGFYYGYHIVFMFCRFSGNGRHGIYAGYYHTLDSCVVDGNGVTAAGRGIHFLGRCPLVRNCAIDGNSDDGVYLQNITAYNASIIGNRITNNVGFGIDMAAAADESNVEDYNVFYNNTAGDRNNIAVGANSVVATSVYEAGYEDRAAGKFSTARGALLYRQVVSIDSDNFLHLCAGLPTKLIPVLGAKR